MNDQILELRTNLTNLSLKFEQHYNQLKSDLNQWHIDELERIDDMYLNTLIDLDTSYERLDRFRQTLYVLLDDQRLIERKPLINRYLKHYSTRLSSIENEIDFLSNLFFHLNSQQVKYHHRPCLIHQNPLSTLPYRFLLKREHLNYLSDNAFCQFLTHPTSPEAILITTNLPQLSIIIEQIFIQTNELRILIHEYYAPFIIGQLGSRAKLLKDKYQLTHIQIYPTCAPLSTERILLLSGTKQDLIYECLKEIYLNICQTPIQQATFFYSPEFYDITLVDDYGGYIDRQVQLATQRTLTNSNTNHLNHSNNTNDDDENLSNYEDEVVEDFDHDNATNYSTETVEPLRERHWTLSDAQAGALFGPNSSRLHQIRSESNAWIVIYEAEGKSTRRPMSIRGTKAEIEHATKLILETIKRHDRKLPIKHNHKRGK